MAHELLDRGYGEVYALKGGFDAWRQAGYPVVPRTSEVGARGGAERRFESGWGREAPPPAV